MTREETIEALQAVMFVELWEGATDKPPKPEPKGYRGVGYTLAERALDYCVEHGVS